MGRLVDVDLLVGAEEIASRLGMARANIVYDWKRRHADFPAPIVKLHRAQIWYWPEIEAWAAKTGRM